MEKNTENPLNIFSRAIGALTRWAEDGRNEDEKPILDFSSFNLDNLAASFSGVKEESFLTEAPLQALISELDPHDFSLFGRGIPEGVRITLCALPADRNGLAFPPGLLDDGKNKIYPYFQILYSNPAQNSGLAMGLGNITAAPYLQLIPEEIRLQCSFVVEYMPGGERRDGESDYRYFSRLITEKYRRLQELLKGRML